MKVTIVRHGETEYNRNLLLQGRGNYPLNDEGRRMCHKLREKTDKIDFDICFSSPLIRAVETAMILVGDRVEIIRDDRIIERCLGDFEGKDVNFYDSSKYWDYNLNCGDSNVEPVQDIFKRCNDFLNYLRDNYSDKSVLIVAHGAVVKAFHYILNNTNLNSNLGKLHIPNCYIETVDYNPKKR